MINNSEPSYVKIRWILNISESSVNNAFVLHALHALKNTKVRHVVQIHMKT